MTDASHLDTLTTLVPIVVWLMAVTIISAGMYLKGMWD